MKGIKWIGDLVLKVYAVIGMVALILVIITTFLQVLSRYALESSFPWTEEGARYAFIWMSMMGASLAVRHGSNAAIDILDGVFKGISKRIWKTVLFLAMIGAAVIIFPYGIQMVGNMMIRSSAALGIPMGYVYLAIPIGCVGIMVQAFYGILELWTSEKETV